MSQAIDIPPGASATGSEVARRADFSIIRYAQCWEDSDVLLEALAIRPGDRCFSVASGGDNTLSMLACAPGEVVAVDLSVAQIACVELKAAGFRVLEHRELLELVGVSESARRLELYEKVRPALSPLARGYWDAHRDVLERGLASAGKFETYFALFRRVVLPLIHSRDTVDSMIRPRSAEDRRVFYDSVWNNRRWRALFRLFFSRPVMGRAGRDPSFFKYVEGGISAAILGRAEHALVDLDPSINPYLHWIAYGRFGSVLPHTWRPENFRSIRENVDKLRLRVAAAEAALADLGTGSVDRFNLSDIFEYVSEQATEQMFEDIVRSGRAGGRAAYWNMMAPRRRPERLANRLVPLEDLSRQLHARALSFFYGGFFVDELREPERTA